MLCGAPLDGLALGLWQGAFIHADMSSVERAGVEIWAAKCKCGEIQSSLRAHEHIRTEAQIDCFCANRQNCEPQTVNRSRSGDEAWSWKDRRRTSGRDAVISQRCGVQGLFRVLGLRAEKEESLHRNGERFSELSMFLAPRTR